MDGEGLIELLGPPVTEEASKEFSLARLDPDFARKPDGKKLHSQRELYDQLTVDLLKDKRWDINKTAVQNSTCRINIPLTGYIYRSCINTPAVAAYTQWLVLLIPGVLMQSYELY